MTISIRAFGDKHGSTFPVTLEEQVRYPLTRIPLFPHA